MGEIFSPLFSVAAPGGAETRPWLLSPAHIELATLLQILGGFALIMATVWTVGPTQRFLFWTSASWFAGWGVLARCQKRGQGFQLPSAQLRGLLVFIGLMRAGVLLTTAASL